MHTAQLSPRVSYQKRRVIISDGKIDSNRFTLPNRNEKFSIQCHNYNALATCISVLQDRVMAHIRVNVATRFYKGN